MSERAERLRAAEAVCSAAATFRAEWDLASILDEDTPAGEHRWDRKFHAEKELGEALDRWKAAGGQTAPPCIGYTGETETARIDVWDNRDGTLAVIVTGANTIADWTITNAEARQIIQGLVTVL